MKFFFFILCISLLVLILSKSDELSILKALACVNIITSRHQNEEKDPSTLSPKILTCFIKISDEQISKLLDNIEQGLDISLTEDEINNLMDIDSLKDLPQDEVKQKGEQLEEAIKEFQKTQGEYNSEDNNGYDEAYDDEDDDYEDYDGPKNNMTKKGFFRLIKKGFINLIEILFSSWYIICILVVFYLLLLEIRRNNHNKNKIKEEKEKDKKDNTIKEKKEENIKNDEDKIKEKKEEENKNEEKSKEDSEKIKEKMD